MFTYIDFGGDVIEQRCSNEEERKKIIKYLITTDLRYDTPNVDIFCFLFKKTSMASVYSDSTCQNHSMTVAKRTNLKNMQRNVNKRCCWKKEDKEEEENIFK